MSYAQRYQVSPAVILEAAGRLTATFKKIVRQSRPLPKEPSGLELAKAQQSFAEVEQNRLDLIVHCSLFIVHCSLFLVHCSLFIDEP